MQAGKNEGGVTDMLEACLKPLLDSYRGALQQCSSHASALEGFAGGVHVYLKGQVDILEANLSPLGS